MCGLGVKELLYIIIYNNLIIVLQLSLLTILSTAKQGTMHIWKFLNVTHDAVTHCIEKERTRGIYVWHLSESRKHGLEKIFLNYFGEIFGGIKENMYLCTRKTNMVPVVQLVRASDCGSECRGFESHRAPCQSADNQTITALFLFLPPK